MQEGNVSYFNAGFHRFFFGLLFFSPEKKSKGNQLTENSLSDKFFMKTPVWFFSTLSSKKEEVDGGKETGQEEGGSKEDGKEEHEEIRLLPLSLF
ncbi:MAG: hypothetical protein HZB21_07665 [Deltaproteobacteria bacterium]|nr:hypothetical protein [Deltaproteobacteria bacterium]